MTISDAFSTFMKLRRIVAIVSIIAGAGSYKYGPTVWHKAQDEISAKSKTSVHSKSSGASTNSEVSTNADGVLLSDCDLGDVSLTNHFETSVSLGKGKDCILTPKLIDRHNVSLTLAVETKGANGRVHDLSITEVVARIGKPLDVAVGGFSFSLTPKMDTE
jgi:hypothetical protein